MSYEVYVLNHISRDTDLIKSQLEKGNIPYKIFTDTSTYRLFKETRWRGLLENYMKIVIHIAKNQPNGAIIIHDDITFSKDVYKKMCYVIKEANLPNLLSFYNPTNKGYIECDKQGKHVLKTHSNWWSQCVYMPNSIAKTLEYQFYKNYTTVINTLAEDRFMCSVFSNQDINAYAIVPSMIQHVGYDKSTLGIPAKVGKHARKSSTFDSSFDVYSVDWAAEFKEPYVDRNKQTWI